MTITATIFQQLGGNRFKAMTGAKLFAAYPNSLSFRLSGTMTKQHINYVKITLNILDLYDIEFINIRAGKSKTISIVNGVYNNMLQQVIADKTGLALSL